MLGVANIVFRSDETNPAALTPTLETLCLAINSFTVSAIV